MDGNRRSKISGAGSLAAEYASTLWSSACAALSIGGGPGRVDSRGGATPSGGVRGVVVVPLQKHAMTEVTGETIMQTAPELMGVLYMDSSARPTALTGLDRQVLQTFALEGATVIENARLFRITREQERIQHEFSLARRIQQDLLPRKLPHGGFFEVHAITMPCQTVVGVCIEIASFGSIRGLENAT